jgi:hypothetical protein
MDDHFDHNHQPVSGMPVPFLCLHRRTTPPSTHACLLTRTGGRQRGRLGDEETRRGTPANASASDRSLAGRSSSTGASAYLWVDMIPRLNPFFTASDHGRAEKAPQRSRPVFFLVYNVIGSFVDFVGLRYPKPAINFIRKSSQILFILSSNIK